MFHTQNIPRDPLSISQGDLIYPKGGNEEQNAFSEIKPLQEIIDEEKTSKRYTYLDTGSSRQL